MHQGYLFNKARAQIPVNPCMYRDSGCVTSFFPFRKRAGKLVYEKFGKRGKLVTGKTSIPTKFSIQIN